MSIPAWHVINWAPVRISVRDFQRTRCAFRHLSTAVQSDGDQEGLRSGQTLWGMECGGRWLGVAFEWAEMTQDVAVLSDPMHILTNVELVEEDGRPVADALGLVHLNTAIHELDWQQQIPGRPPVWAERLAA